MSKTMRPGALWQILRQTISDFGEDEGLERAAALAFYTTLGLSPTLLFCLSIADHLGHDVRDSLLEEIKALIGPESAQGIDLLLEAAQHNPDGSLWAASVGLATVFFSVSGIFVQLQSTLNHIWNVRLKSNVSIRGWVRARLLSLSMVLAVLFLLLASTVVSATISSVFSSGQAWWHGVNFAISLGVYTLLFALMFKLLPDAKISYRDVWLGAAITAVLFAVGKLGIGLYIGNSAIASSYGAAGSLVAILVWLYYSAAIVFFGAELTQVVATRWGHGAVPSDHAEPEGAASGG